MISPFALPSTPEKKITLREATVADALDFADVDEGHEEELTTLFLNRMQDKASFIDSRTWTADDRRFALYWYWLHTTKDTEIALTYECGYCGKRHTFLQDFRKLADAYAAIKGLPERDVEWEGEKLVVRPLSGADMEFLENMRMGLDVIRESQGDASGAYRKRAALIRVERLLRHIDFPMDLSATDPVKRLENRKKRILGLGAEKFADLAGLVFETLTEMKHGLESEYVDGRLNLVMPRSVSFRNSDYIPGL